ncbi:primosomal protein DnaI [Halalkalibacter oceani]|uniref:primosomal protein DnaI n=1 Tax=Halalkalibacter oceani TaxID=1653776 RepID=UPI00339B2D90
MKSIQSSLTDWMQNSSLRERLDRAMQELLTDPFVQSALQRNPDINQESIEQGLVKLYEFRKESYHCETCPGLANCPNMMKGYRPELISQKGALDLHYHPCHLKREEDEKKQQQQLMRSLYVPKEILAASFDTLDRDQDRAEACRKALAFALHANPGENGEGLYLYGKFGVGKTHIMGAVMNALKSRRIGSMIVYTPDFFREMKQAIGDGSFQQKLDMVKSVQVLILDDIGAETISGWIRDDVLGAILQHRMLEKLPTLFTSNYDYEELEEHLAYSDRGGTEELKAKRIMERIKHFTAFVTVEGKNRRSR